jgi:hypothetical protein
VRQKSLSVPALSVYTLRIVALFFDSSSHDDDDDDDDNDDENKYARK